MNIRQNPGINPGIPGLRQPNPEIPGLENGPGLHIFTA